MTTVIVYTFFKLFLLGILGILGHSFVELGKLNKQANGDYKMVIGRYLKLEIFSLLTSLIVVGICASLSNEIQAALDKAGYGWALGISYVCLGYFGQSLLVAIMGKAGKVVGIENTPPSLGDDKK